MVDSREHDRSRPRRRGRKALALVAVGLGFAGLVLALNIFAPPQGSRPSFALPLPTVSTAPLKPMMVPAVPHDLLERLPVGPGNRVYDGHASVQGDAAAVTFASSSSDPSTGPRLVEFVAPAPEGVDLHGPLRVEYSIDSDLTERIDRVLRMGRVKRGNVVVLDPRSGRVIAYVSTDPESFPPNALYPSASIIKIVTAAAVLELAPEAARRPCRYRGSPYRLTSSRVRPPRVGRETSFEGALAMSNNQCFAQFAVNALGSEALLAAINRFGWLDSPAPGHPAGRADAGESDYDLGRLGSGLEGALITPLHAASLAASLRDGVRIEPWWVDRVLDAEGRELRMPPRAEPVRVLSSEAAEKLRRMMVRTTTRGTARGAFRDRRGRPKLGPIRVAGKTGNISGWEPRGRYEWFVGVAPAEDPSIAIAVVQLHGHLWWQKSSELAAGVLKEVFCDRGSCTPELASRYTGALSETASPVFLSDSTDFSH